MRKEIVSRIINELESLPYKKQLAFAYLACLRTLPNYEYFNRAHKFGDPIILKRSLDLIDRVFRNEDVDRADLDIYISEIDSICPVPEKFDTVLASSALDCCSCFIETLSFIKDKKIGRLTDIVNLCLDAVDMFLVVILNLDVNDQDIESVIYKHPLMTKEVDVQKGILGYLKRDSDFTYDELDVLLKLQQVNGENVGSLDLVR